MARQFIDSRDETNAGLHAMVAVIERQLRDLPVSAVAADDEARIELGRSWGKLVSLLALEPEHQRRTCPQCGNVGMRAATRCGHCWIKLVPPPAAVNDQG